MTEGEIRLRAIGIDHIVVLTADVERSLAFYVDRLGLAPMRVEDRPGNDKPRLVR